MSEMARLRLVLASPPTLFSLCSRIFWQFAGRDSPVSALSLSMVRSRRPIKLRDAVPGRRVEWLT